MSATLLLTLLSASPPALAVTREDALMNAAIFSTHVWTMGAANETASCSSSYSSDYSAGQTITGIPYDWGGFVTTSEYDQYIAEGYGAGSHSWHGVLWCTVGVDCSGFVSQAWETSSKYGTATFYQVTHDIGVSDLERADALNKASSHIVMWAYQTDAGLPVHYETNGTVVFVDSDQGWSAFSGYTAIRYDSIEDGPETGTASAPVEITAFPYSDLRYTAGAASSQIDSYSCASSTDESGPEQLYRFEVATAGTLTLTVSDDTYTDVDIHVLTAPSGDACLDRDDSELSLWLEPGEYWISADSYVSSSGDKPGPYLLSGSFTGTLGDSSEGTEGSGDGDEGVADEGSEDGSGQGGGQGGAGGGGQGGESGSHGGYGAEPRGERIGAREAGGCATASDMGELRGLAGLAGIAALLLGLRRREPGARAP